MNQSREMFLMARYAVPILRTRWIGEVFHTYLKQPSGPTRVAALAVGRGEELPHLRHFVGHGATIHAFDILEPETLTSDLAELAQVTYHREGIQRIDKVIRLLGGEPNIVVCRAPRIVETVSKRGLRFNTWWEDTLAGYAQRVHRKGQMLITTYTDEERQRVAAKFRDRGIRFQQYENDLCPIPTPQAQGPNGIIRSGIDKFVLVSE